MVEWGMARDSWIGRCHAEDIGDGWYVLHDDSLAKEVGVPQKSGWAFGLGLERIAMVLFQIPDIRLFWSEDARFLGQFSETQITTFKPYSKYPPCYKDVSFWVPKKEFHENDFCEIVRDVAGDLVENVTLVSRFTTERF